MGGKIFTQTKWIEELRKGRPVFSLPELVRITGLPPASARRAVSRLVKRRFLIKLSKGLYGNAFAHLSLEQVAGMLYPPAYISVESALFTHGVIDQTPHIVTCITLNKTKTFRTALGEILYYHIKSGLFFGFHPQDGLVLAGPEKAAADYVYIKRQNGLFPDLDEWNWGNLDLLNLREILKSYPKSVEKHIMEFAH
ncbi:helix-turn-helix domain-containing protein [candidate division KSB1 bacterium]|nr:helix-turn-helix domain-containing protein [candidate division KSB1 bacterium]